MSKWIFGLQLLSSASSSLPPCSSLENENTKSLFRQTTCHLETFLFGEKDSLRVNGTRLAGNSTYQLSEFAARDDRAFPEVKWLAAGAALEINNESVCVIDLKNGTCDIRSVLMLYHEFSQQQNDGLLLQTIMNQPFVIGIDPPAHLKNSSFETSYSLCEPAFLDVSGAIYSKGYYTNGSETRRSIPDACINDGHKEEECRSIFDETIKNYCSCGEKELNAPETALVITKKNNFNFLALFSIPATNNFAKDMRYEDKQPVYRTPENYFLTDDHMLPQDGLNYWDCAEPYSKLQIFQQRGQEVFFSRAPKTIKSLSGRNYTLPKEFRVVIKPSTLVMKIETTVDDKLYKASKLIRIADSRFSFFPEVSLKYDKSDSENYYFTVEMTISVPENFYDFPEEDEKLVQVLLYAFNHLDFRILDVIVHQIALKPYQSKAIDTIKMPKTITLNNVKRSIDMLDGYVTLSEEPRLDIENVLFQDASEGVKFARKSDHCHELHEFCDAVTYTPSMPSFEEIFSRTNSANRFAEFVSMAYVNDNKRIQLQEINPCCPERSFEKGMNLTTTRTLRIEMHQLASILYNRDEEDYRVILYFSTYSRPLFAPEYDASPCSVDVPNYIANPVYYVRKTGTKFGRGMYEGDDVPERHFSGIYWNITSKEIFELHERVNSQSNKTDFRLWLWLAIEFNTSDSRRRESPCIMINDDYDISVFVREQRAVNRDASIVQSIKIGLLFFLLVFIFGALHLIQRKWQKLWKDSKPTPAQLTLYPVREPSEDISEAKWPTGDSNRAKEFEEPLNSISDTLLDENDNLLNRYFPGDSFPEKKNSPFEQMPLIESDAPGYKFNPMLHQPTSQVLQAAPTLQAQPLIQVQENFPANFGGSASGGYKTMEAISCPPESEYK